ncbi:hemophore-related protein [Nocardia harenae]|uniref:hemophore-related protein n=1 Tax=Nocardia harenae TaxID=358707 RepID=UPI00082B85E9|nr:hemophore-related protein [Nocardia harenae]
MRIVRASALAALAATGALLTAAPAQAEPELPATTCSYEQVEAAVRAEFPGLAARLDAHPEARDRARAFFALSPEQRQQRVQQFLDSHPQARERKDSPRAQQFRDRMRVILQDTCHRY